MAYAKKKDILPLIGTKDASNTQTGVALTTSYENEGSGATKSFKSNAYDRAVFNIFYTPGSGETGTSVQAIIEVSTDGDNWVQIPNDASSGGTSTLTDREFTYDGTGTSIFFDIGYEYMRISLKETGVSVNAGTVYVDATMSVI